jgi:hypothetical protein
MADNCCESDSRCCAPPPLQFPDSSAAKPNAPTSCDADAACGCHGGVLRFDGLDPRYKRVLWTVIVINGAMFLTEMAAGQLAGSQALKADALDFLADTLTYGLSLAVIGAALRTRAAAALLKGLSLSLMAAWVLGSTVYHTLILGLPSADLMGGIGVLALAANLASVLLLRRYKDGDANVRSVWLCSRNDAIGNIVVMVRSSISLRIARTCVATCPSNSASAKRELLRPLFSSPVAKLVSTLNDASVHTMSDSTDQIAWCSSELIHDNHKRLLARYDSSALRLSGGMSHCASV